MKKDLMLILVILFVIGGFAFGITTSKVIVVQGIFFMGCLSSTVVLGYYLLSKEN